MSFYSGVRLIPSFNLYTPSPITDIAYLDNDELAVATSDGSVVIFSRDGVPVKSWALAGAIVDLKGWRDKAYALVASGGTSFALYRVGIDGAFKVADVGPQSAAAIAPDDYGVTACGVVCTRYALEGGRLTPKCSQPLNGWAEDSASAPGFTLVAVEPFAFSGSPELKVVVSGNCAPKKAFYLPSRPTSVDFYGAVGAVAYASGFAALKYEGGDVYEGSRITLDNVIDVAVLKGRNMVAVLWGTTKAVSVFSGYGIELARVYVPDDAVMIAGSSDRVAVVHSGSSAVTVLSVLSN